MRAHSALSARFKPLTLTTRVLLLGCAVLTLAVSPLARKPCRSASHANNAQSLKRTTPPVPAPSGAATPRVLANLAALPLSFEPNRGQTGRRVQFLARGGDYTAFLTANEVVFAFRARPWVRRTETRARQRSDSPARGRARGRSLRLRWLGANPCARGVGLETLRTKSNYFLGNNPVRWRTDVPHYARVRYARLYPGVDAVFYGRQQELAYDLIMAPGSDPGKIKFELQGASRLQRNAHGDLVLQTGGHDVVLRRPVIYQETGGTRRYVEGRYVRKGRRTIGFAVAAYGRRRPLVIDPSLSVTYASFLGGSGSDIGNSVVLDSSGVAYIGGNTTVADFPESGANKVGNGGSDDLFIAKIDTTKNGAASLVYLTFLAGSRSDDGGFLAVDSAGRVAFLAKTTSSDFPVTDHSKRHAGPNDLIVGELNASGDALVFATYFGGDGSEMIQGAAGTAMDAVGNFYVTSDTSSTDLPTTSGAFHTAYGGGASDGFLSVFNSSGSLSYCTYFGINATVGSAGVAVDLTKPANTFLTGFTSDPHGTFTVKNAFQAAYSGGAFDAFVMKIAPKGSGANDLVYSTFLGGSGLDKAAAIAIDSSSPPNAYVTGMTQSADFPTSGAIAAFQSSFQGPSDAFVSVISQKSSGATSLNYSTYLGGMGDDNGLAIAVVTPNQVYVAGKTTSIDFPAQNFLQPFSGTSDGFVVKLDPTLSGTSSLLYATYLGGGADAQANAVAADSKGNAFVTGQTTSADFPLAGNPNNGFQPICTSCNLSPPLTDAFLTVLTEDSAPSPEAAFSPSGLNFGSLAVGASSPPQTVILSNNGNAALSITGIGVTGTNSGDFSQINNCLAPATLDAGSSCAITITFTPTVGAAESATVNVFDNASGNPQSVTLRGTGTEPLAVPSPTSVNFGNQPQGGTSSAQTITVANAGNITLQIGPISLGGANPTDFSFTNTNCGATVAAGANCSLRVNFIPTGVGTFSGDLIIADNSGNKQGSTQAITLSGMGTPPAPSAGFSPATLNFGTQVVGGVTAAQTVMLKNTGSPGYPLHITGISITGTNAKEFNLPASGTLCPIGGNGLQPGAICDIVADFAPSSPGAKSAAITVTDDASDSPQMIPLSGTAIAPVISLTPASLAFSDQPVGTTSAPQSVTLGNTGNAALTIASISITGANAGDFSQNNNCPPNLNPNKSCIIQVAFAPAQTGSRAATLMIADNAIGNPHSVSLGGNGVAPIVLLTPSGVTFGAQFVGSGASPVAVTVTNNGSGPLSITKISFSGANSGDFSAADPTCGTPVSVGGTCTINVAFQPAAAGSRSAVLNVTDNALGSPQTATLTGTGTDFTFAAASGGSTSLTLTPGHSGSYNLQLTPSDGFSGSVALSCSGTLPAGTCSASPATLNVSGTAAATFAVNVSTTASLPPAVHRRIIRPPQRLPVLAMVLALAALILASAFTKRRWRLGWATTGALLLVLALLNACGGGGGGGGGGAPPGTPPGTYNLTVTGTQQGSSRTLNLTLVVQ
jgi:hypothetical protein